MEISTISVNININTIQSTTSTMLVDGFKEKHRKLQKQREERELTERREQKERMKEALEAYVKYRRELRHYYNELGYQKKRALSCGVAALPVNVKKPQAVSAVYELIIMLGM